jgi:hypothetical protein
MDCFIYAVAALLPMKGTVALLCTSLVQSGIVMCWQTLAFLGWL